MPLLFTRNNPTGTLAVWTMTETVEELMTMISLNETDQETMALIPNANRKREFLTIRILLFIVTGTYPDLRHDAQRKPFLCNSSRNISISHSGKLAAIYLSDYQAGIDTEVTTRDISRVLPRFLSPEELHWTTGTADPNTAGILCWSIKESVFKMMGKEGVDFRSQMIIKPLIPGNSGEAEVLFRHGKLRKTVRVLYLLEGDNVITWCDRG
jgi:4'-phosphopantetheinyl transferase